MQETVEQPGFGWRRPWRFAPAGWVVAVLAFITGVPLFLCMPPWNDVTLHDMAARSILRGGVHYRDVFDTNLPGIDWAMAAVRAVFGRSYEVLHAVDLLVIGGIVALLCGWVWRAGSAAYSIAWFVAAAALFYPFTSEFNHVQRDPWMLLPAVIAARLRLKQVQRVEVSFRWAVCEGIAWGASVWVKPHALVPAFAVWLVSAVLLARRQGRKRVAADFAGLLLGGILAGAPGVTWLVATGAWPYFRDVFLNWNPSYLSDLGSVWPRFFFVFDCFRPWSLLHFAALPLALLALWEARLWSRRTGEPAVVPSSLYLPAPSADAANARALLAALYLAWLAQSVVVQKPFDYVHIPLTFLGMAVVASQRWCFGFVYLFWFLAVGVLVNVSSGVRLEPHPLTDPQVLKLWPRCWSEGSSPELRDRLGRFTNTAWGTNWRELNEVADYLRPLELGPGELNCWHDTTHPLYLMLDLNPATRYMHYGTAFGIKEQRPLQPGEKSKRERIADEVRASNQRYVVCDLLRTTHNPRKVYDPAAWPESHLQPLWLPANERAKFPWNQHPVFRAGRYVVYKIDPAKPLGIIRVPDWDKVEQLAQFGPDE